jgi:Tfp pilus assembly protein PilF
MKRVALAILSAAVLTFLVVASPVSAQGELAQVRGRVFDKDHNPIMDVVVKFDYRGEKTSAHSTFKVNTDKKGGFVRIGIPSGPYTLTFFKPGYKLQNIDSYLSFGSLSEIPDVTLEKLPEGVQGLSPDASKEEIDAAQKKAAQTTKLRKVINDAITAVEAQDWATAEGLLNQVLKETPDQPIVYANLGYVARKKGDLPAAEAAYRKAVELDPTDGETFAILAVVLESDGKRAEAVDMLVKAAPRFENNLPFQSVLGAIAMNAGRNDEAEAAFKRVLALKPSSAEAHLHLATFALNQGHTPEALEHLKQCVALAPAGSSDSELAKQLIAALTKK